MRKYLLPKDANSYKANLHTHTNISDGHFSPEEIKKFYKDQGYSIIAYTDHDVFLQHNDLSDSEFLALNAYEMEVNQLKSDATLASNTNKTCHMCLIALDPDMETPVCWHREKYLFRNAINHRDEVKNDESLPDYERVYSAEGISDMMRLGRENGFFVTYNHPMWSMEEYADYTSYNGMHAMEIVNGECVAMGFCDHNERVYDDMLNSGKRIYCVATDDTHHTRGMFFGATVIKADKLEYKSVADALVNGNFYATEGPEIKQLYLEDGKLVVETSAVDSIRLNTGARIAKRVANSNGTPITRAVFELPLDKELYYIRVTATDKGGKCAHSNAYFLDELTEYLPKPDAN